MNSTEYFKHARSLGAFSAKDCLELAKMAAQLDEEAKARKAVPWVTADTETVGDISTRLSFAIKVF